jgi:hypothetical protein
VSALLQLSIIVRALNTRCVKAVAGGSTKTECWCIAQQALRMGALKSFRDKLSLSQLAMMSSLLAALFFLPSSSQPQLTLLNALHIIHGIFLTSFIHHTELTYCLL